MDYDIQNFLDSLYVAIAGFYHSSFFLTIKILAGVYLLILFVDIVLLLILRDIPYHLRVGLRGDDMPLVSKSKMQKRWDKIKSRLKSPSASQYKVAIIEADALADEILGGIGYSGANMTEKLEQVGKAHLDDHLDSLREVHLIRNKIIHETDYEINQEAAAAVLGVYENFLKYLEYLE